MLTGQRGSRDLGRSPSHVVEYYLVQDENSVEAAFRELGLFSFPSCFWFVVHGCRRSSFLVVPVSSLEKGRWRLERSPCLTFRESFYRTSQVGFGLGDSNDALVGEKGLLSSCFVF